MFSTLKTIGIGRTVLNTYVTHPVYVLYVQRARASGAAVNAYENTRVVYKKKKKSLLRLPVFLSDGRGVDVSG